MMKSFVKELVGKKASDLNPDFKINCFRTAISYFSGEISNGKTTAQEMLNWLQEYTTQIEKPELDSIVVVWSSSDTSKSPNSVLTEELKSEAEGYPFGLIMEHAGVFVTETEIFQKASPKDEDKFEVIHFSKLLNLDYRHLAWMRLTYHRVTEVL